MELSNNFRRLRYPIEDGKEETEEPKDNRKWAATESTVVFDLCDLIKKIKNKIIEKNPEADPVKVTELIGKSLSVLKLNDQSFTFSTTPNKLGGVRWFIHCPKCDKKSLKLYLPKTTDREHLYLCKTCHRLKPESLLSGNRKKYRNVTRHLKRLEKIEKRILKKRLGAKEAETLLEEHANLEKLLADSVEYRLWLFRREHGNAT